MGFFYLWIALVLNRSQLRVGDWRENPEEDFGRRSWVCVVVFMRLETSYEPEEKGLIFILSAAEDERFWSFPRGPLGVLNCIFMSWKTWVNAALLARRKHAIQMMFNISIDGGSFSKNLEDFDSIRSVLLYRSVKHNCLNKLRNSLFSHTYSCELLCGQRQFVRGFVNTAGDLKTPCKPESRRR